MIRLERSVVVNRPIEEIWAFMTDPFNAPRERSGILALRQTSPGPMGVGSTLEARIVVFGFEARISGPITEWDPPHAATISFRGARCRAISTRQILEATADGTKLTRVSQIDPRPAFKPLYWIALPLYRSAMGARNQKIKRLLESGRGG